jgi:hypothetical protein
MPRAPVGYRVEVVVAAAVGVDAAITPDFFAAATIVCRGRCQLEESVPTRSRAAGDRTSFLVSSPGMGVSEGLRNWQMCRFVLTIEPVAPVVRCNSRGHLLRRHDDESTST